MMKIKKTILAKMEKPYAISSLKIDGEPYFLAASEERHGKCLLFHPPDFTRSTVIWDSPGGCMTMSPLSSGNGSFIAIQKFYPIFDSDQSTIVLAEPAEDLTEKWNMRVLSNLPFVHRCEVIRVAGVEYLVAAVLCGGKEYIEDWSLPGSVYVAKIPQNAGEELQLVPVMDGITKNHGMFVCEKEGRQVVYISGQEGVFLLDYESSSRKWVHTRILDHGVSDLFLADIDGDGVDEMVTIEPFHGNRLVIYKVFNSSWKKVYETEMDFGHVIWAGNTVLGPTVFMADRGGAKALSVLQPKTLGTYDMRKMLIDTGVGAAQISVSNQLGKTLLLSANHGIDEVALYEIS